MFPTSKLARHAWHVDYFVDFSPHHWARNGGGAWPLQQTWHGDDTDK